MSDTPKTQMKILVIGTAIALVSMIALLFTSSLESTLLFYLFVFFMAVGIAIAIPGYIGIWVWRMRDTLFRDK